GIGSDRTMKRLGGDNDIDTGDSTNRDKDFSLRGSRRTVVSRNKLLRIENGRVRHVRASYFLFQQSAKVRNVVRKECIELAGHRRIPGNVDIQGNEYAVFLEHACLYRRNVHGRQ